MENKFELKPFDKVLVRDEDSEIWQIDIFKAYFSESGFACLVARWKQCIPYEGNEHLLRTTDKPERYDSNKNTLFGIKLKPGYVLEFEDNTRGVIFPTKIDEPNGTGLAIMYLYGSWQRLEKADLSKVTVIRNQTDSIDLISGELLWEKPKKQTFTKAEIAEKLGMKVKDFEIVDE